MVLNDIIEQAAGRPSRGSDLQGNFIYCTILDSSDKVNTDSMFTWKFYIFLVQLWIRIFFSSVS